jgi:UPF0716 protein FxsA
MNPFLLILLLLIAVPLSELFILIKIGHIIGAFPTIMLALLTAGLGAFLVRREGVSVLAKINSSFQNREAPAVAVLEAFFLLISGLFLLTPGFITDIIGFIFLSSFIRQKACSRIAQNFVRHADTSSNTSASSRTIEGNYKVEDD